VLSEEDLRGITNGSPMTKLSPAFTDGTRPSEPTKAAAASLIRRRVDALKSNNGVNVETHERISP
jgi:hypothetical protein